MAVYLCPHCGFIFDYSYLSQLFLEVFNCKACFEYACPDCENLISIDVIPIPEFELHKVYSYQPEEIRELQPA